MNAQHSATPTPPAHGGATAADAAGPAPAAGSVVLLPRTKDSATFLESCHLTANRGAGSNARMRVMPWVRRHWAGNADQASRVADKLVDNAVRHAKAFPSDGGIVTLRVFGFADGFLAIEVDDALPQFPGFQQVANQGSEVPGRPTGLWWVAHYRGVLSWDVKRDVTSTVIGKTVRALLPQTWDGAA
ncbi:hypothetical protein [Streptomyces sp. NPDC048489]|uniref:hypothetical protein n=1 Tax=Streptomyces sp. NPDC048489 TaxID=3154504 RepID=UPI00343AF923